MAAIFKTKIQSTAEQIASAIRDEIFRGVLMPGEKLKEKELSVRFAKSRVPIRESFLLLEKEGMVLFYPNKGAFVASINKKDIIDIFEARKLIEIYCIRRFTTLVGSNEIQELTKIYQNMQGALAAENISSCLSNAIDFHYSIVTSLKNTFISYLFVFP